MALGQTDTYFSELENSEDITSKYFLEESWSLADETETQINHTNSDKVSYRKQLSVKAAKYNRGKTDAGKKRRRLKKQQMLNGDKKASVCKKPNTAEKIVSSLGRQRRALVWSGYSFTSNNHLNQSGSESQNAKPAVSRKRVKKRCAEMRVQSDVSCVRRKRYSKSKIHSPGTHKCDACGRKYCYLRGLRQHQRDSCTTSMNTK